MSPNDARRELKAVSRMPYGLARVAEAEKLARRIETEGPESMLAEAQLDLIEAYTFSEESPKAFLTMAQVLRLWDERPELFDETDRSNLFMVFRWVTSDLVDTLQISRPQAMAAFDDMQRRFRHAGHGLSGVFSNRFRYAWHAGDADTEAHLAEWLATPRDDYSDCKACEPGIRAEYLCEHGRYDEVVALQSQLNGSCNVEPTRGQAALSLAYLMLGNADEAEAARQRAMRRMTPKFPTHLAAPRGQLLEILLRSGRVEQALRRLRTADGVLLAGADTPLAHIRFLLNLLAGLSAVLASQGATPTGLTTIDAPTIADLHRHVHGLVQDLARRFDERNGNTYYARRMAAALAAKPGCPISDAPRAPAPVSAPITPSDRTDGDRDASDRVATDRAGRARADASSAQDPIMTATPQTRMAADAKTLGKLSTDRIRRTLESMEVKFGEDEDGDIVALFDDHYFLFRVSGKNDDVLRIDGRWRAWLPADRRMDAIEAANEWNDNHLFPRAGVSSDNDGDTILRVDRMADLEFGVTDAQLRNELSVAISTGVEYFEFVEDRFPGAVEAAEAWRAARRAAQAN